MASTTLTLFFRNTEGVKISVSGSLHYLKDSTGVWTDYPFTSSGFGLGGVRQHEVVTITIPGYTPSPLKIWVYSLANRFEYIVEESIIIPIDGLSRESILYESLVAEITKYTVAGEFLEDFNIYRQDDRHQHYMFPLVWVRKGESMFSEFTFGNGRILEVPFKFNLIVKDTDTRTVGAITFSKSNYASKLGEFLQDILSNWELPEDSFKMAGVPVIETTLRDEPYSGLIRVYGAICNVTIPISYEVQQ